MNKGRLFVADMRILKKICRGVGGRFLVILLLVGSVSTSRAGVPSYGSESPERLVFYFANSSSMLMRDYRTNETELGQLDRLLQTPAIVSALDSVVIQGGSSVIGSFQTNERLAGERAAAVRSYIRWKHPQFDSDKIRIVPSVFNWDELRERVRRDSSVPYREEVLHVLAEPLSDESKAVRIKRLGNGATENYITEHFARYMRSATSLVFYLQERQGEGSKPETAVRIPDSVPVEKRETVVTSFIGKSESPEPGDPGRAPTDDLVGAFPVPSFAVTERRPLFALKTNLLYDLGSALNVELEIPVGRRWSVAGEWIFPWWLWEKRQYALEVLNGNVEGRYWWGDRSGREPMTGWFTGIYGGVGYYDVEWKTGGYQGEFFSAGLTGGFAHKIGRNWRMEYSLGVGYLGSKYREYVPENVCGDGRWHLIRRRSGDFNWVGPTRAKVSLVWMLRHGDRKIGGK